MPKKSTKKTTSKPQPKADQPADKKETQPEEPKLKKQFKNHIVIKKTDSKNAHWYVVHTYSGHEHKVAATLVQRVKSMKLTDKVFELLIPTQEKIQIRRGKKETIKEKLFPGYMLVKMIVDDNSWLAVRTTPGITSFVGIGNKPTPLPPTEVDTIKKFTKQAAPKFKSAFTMGEAVRIVEGPFADFLGSVDKIDEDKGKVTVLVSIFGRETPVELDFLQVAKV